MTDQEVYEEMKKRGLAVVAGVSLVGNNDNARNENKSVDPFGVKLGANDDILESIDNYHGAQNEDSVSNDKYEDSDFSETDSWKVKNK